MIGRLQVRSTAEVVGEFSFPELILSACSFRCPFHPYAIAVAHKRPWPFCQKCKWQVTAKYACAHPCFRSGLAMLSKHSVGTYQGDEIIGNL